MKNISKLTVIIFCFILFGCEKDNNDENIENPTLIIQTDKEIYSVNDLVAIEIIKQYEIEIEYFICSSYTGIPPIIWKYEDNGWTGFWAPICDGFISHCCGKLEAHDNYDDIFDLEFEKGTYRIEYSFIVEHGQGYQIFYSNEFTFD